MSSQRVTAAVAAEDRSALPAIRGVPWWAAIVIGVGATLAGWVIDTAAGHGELTAVFATCYVVGCIAAVLTVRHTGIFTAVVQPPLILFVAVPTAYYLLHRAEVAGVKDVVINCFYPLIERFGLMFLTSLAVLLIGALRWYLESERHRRAAGTGTTTAAGALLAGLVARIRGLMPGGAPEPGTSGRAPRKHNPNRAAAARRPRDRRPAGQAATRSRHVRPPMDDPDVPMAQPRRRRAPQPGDLGRPADTSVPPPRRRPSHDPAYRREPEYRREPWASDPWEPLSRPSEHPDRPRRTNPRYGMDPDDPPAPRGGAPSSHLPSSNVRYRGSGDAEDGTGYRRPRA